jgi:hypothetical protein
MAQKKPKTYTPKFKFHLVLEVLQGERSEVELGRPYGVHHTTTLQVEASLSGAWCGGFRLQRRDRALREEDRRTGSG